LSSTGQPYSPLPRAFYELACATAACSTEEAYLRSAISRIYFANHLLAIIKATQKFAGFEAQSKGEDHGHVIRAFRRGPTRRLSDLLQGLRDRRNHADYHIELANADCKFCRRRTVDVTTTDWENCLAEAKRCFAGLESL
jgi:hypothetical protein